MMKQELPANSRQLTWQDLGFFIAVAVFTIHSLVYLDFFMDDAYISLRYVLQWINGNGLVYNIGEQVEGYSNFLWIVLLAVPGRLGLDLVMAAKAGGVLISLATMTVAYLYVRPQPYAAAVPLFLAFSASFAAWAMAGLENPLFMFLVLCAAIVFVREEETGRGGWSGILFGLLALTRPEGALFAVVTALYRCVHLLRMRTSPGRQDLWRMVGFLAIVVPHLIWRLDYYGYPLPNTIYAKSMGFRLRTILEGGLYLYHSFVVLGGLFVVLLPSVVALTAPSRPRYVAYFAVLVTAYLVFIAAAGGDWMPLQRFLASVLPLIVLVMHAGIVRLAALFPQKVVPTLVWGVLICQTAFMLMISVDHRFINVGVLPGHLLSRPYPWVEYLKQEVRPGDTVAVFDAGQVAYTLPLDVRIVDMVGLADEHIAHLPAQFPGGLLGRGDAWGKWDANYVLAQKPRFVQTPLGAQDKEGRWATGFTGTTLLVNDPRFQAQYKLVEPPEFYGIFVRKDDE